MLISMDINYNVFDTADNTALRSGKWWEVIVWG